MKQPFSASSSKKLMPSFSCRMAEAYTSASWLVMLYQTGRTWAGSSALRRKGSS